MSTIHYVLGFLLRRSFTFIDQKLLYLFANYFLIISFQYNNIPFIMWISGKFFFFPICHAWYMYTHISELFYPASLNERVFHIFFFFKRIVSRSFSNFVDFLHGLYRRTAIMPYMIVFIYILFLLNGIFFFFLEKASLVYSCQAFYLFWFIFLKWWSDHVSSHLLVAYSVEILSYQTSICS